MKMKRWLAVAGAAGALLAGGLGITAVAASSAGADAAIPGVEGAPSSTQASHPLKDTLDALVADGTITRAQADKVYDAVVTKAKAGKAQRAEQRKDWEAKVGAVVGVTGDELVADLKAGQTLTQIGEAHGKTKQQVIDGLVGLVKNRLDQQVTDKKITQAQADDILAKATSRIGTAVDKPMPHLGDGHNLFRLGRRHGGKANAPAPGSTTTTVH